MSIRKSSKSKSGNNSVDINFLPIPIPKSKQAKGSNKPPKKLVPTTKLVGYTKEGAPIYESIKQTSQNNTNVVSTQHSKKHTMKRRILMG